MKRMEFDVTAGNVVRLTFPIIVDGWLTRRTFKTEVLIDVRRVGADGHVELVIVGPDAGDPIIETTHERAA